MGNRDYWIVKYGRQKELNIFKYVIDMKEIIYMIFSIVYYEYCNKVKELKFI